VRALTDFLFEGLSNDGRLAHPVLAPAAHPRPAKRSRR
jgi:hypothetical protein